MDRRGFLTMAGATAALPAVASASVASIREGDVVILKFRGVLWPRQREMVLETCKKLFPGHKVALLEDGADIEILRRS